MAKMANFDYSDFKKMAKSFQKALDERVIERWIREFLLEMAFRAERKIKKRTPVGVYSNQVSFTTKDGKEVNFTTSSSKTGGHLRRNWQVGNVIKQGDSYVVEIFNNTEYASYVEYGHRTKNHKGWVEGRFMATISMQEIERQLPKFLERKQVELLNQILNGRA
ncbi:TPA: HK97 gp10 family phage protein [Clostridium botulinum]|uniref:HK97 gp10 family phage protein n=1 Tax=Clostridium botulinum TaxID=1491 RepID=UPI0006D205D7|nr:HK97 gp10 family phage protein [Clostridium botulinum]HDK7223543.1 HK97 gp10 family phage protein [Clostridium botulinum]HDK7271125.1 HK97 gp10 family phage protein [Clostridium botulinum]HDK7304481.1 HK97 gp10 family phage protein [Clostridium botulinum]